MHELVTVKDTCVIAQVKEQQQLPVFKLAALEGAPADYQTRSESPSPARAAPCCPLRAAPGNCQKVSHG